eukprot:468799-Amphidinium_carterae.1
MQQRSAFAAHTQLRLWRSAWCQDVRSLLVFPSLNHNSSVRRTAGLESAPLSEEHCAHIHVHAILFSRSGEYCVEIPISPCPPIAALSLRPQSEI